MYNNRRYNNKRGNSGGGHYHYFPNQGQPQPYYQAPPPPPKKSGAVYTKISKGNFVGEIIVNAWNKSKARGMITATVKPYKDSKVYKNSKGEEKMTMIAVVNYLNSGVEKVIPCSMNLETQVIVLEEIGMCISPNGKGHTSSGKAVSGYFGTFNK